MPISSAVSIPSRVIISSVNRNTPANADAPVFSASTREMPFDVALDAPRGAPHVDGERRDRHRRDDREQTFPAARDSRRGGSR